ncbi:hypothetical protein SDC9_47635 [bioreactor metagenome]|uniref:Alpha-L-glutamate ligase-related protein ATP-grasp domain-containing protein n=1 Tax=bioreactor metagenome TaxID=1076179 RepID=A0A644WC41_9ZZZZ
MKKYIYYIVKRLSEKSIRGRYKEKYKFEFEEFERCEVKKKSSLIKKEKKILFNYWKAYPFQYYRYKFYRSDCNLSIDEMKNYIPDYFAYYVFFPQAFKDRNVLFEDKKIFSFLCDGYRINQPNNLLFVSNKRLFNNKNELCSVEQAVENINHLKFKKIFVKPTFGVGGKGINVFHKEGDCYINNENEVLDIEYVNLLLKDDFIIQSGIIQNKYLNEIYPHSINTFRMFTECNQNEVKILFSILRIGRNKNEVDNASSGGIYIKISTENGELDKYALSGNGESFSEHPDTNFKFENFVIPEWDKIKKFTTDLALMFSEVKYIGWDIALSSEGPIVIEANNGPDISLLQDCYGGISNVLNIKKPIRFLFNNDFHIVDK